MSSPSAKNYAGIKCDIQCKAQNRGRVQARHFGSLNEGKLGAWKIKLTYMLIMFKAD